MAFKFELKHIIFKTSEKYHKVKKVRISKLQKSINEIIENLKILEELFRPDGESENLK